MSRRSQAIRTMSRLTAVQIVLCFVFVSGGAGTATEAYAGLGRSSQGVEADRALLQAVRTSSPSALYTTHVLTLPNGGVVKEFARADGMVFAVTWRAPGRPDLRQLLGESYDTLQSATPARVGRPVRRPIGMKTSSLMVVSGGHPGAFSGLALLPQLQPAGLDPGELK